ncbi:WSC domain-containing protein [Scenedesmus sp. PABB004]|nr:WSC domain-containing protein [Scenedesmus sp. PABB004]
MFALAMTTLAPELEARGAPLRDALARIERDGVLHQGCGPGVARGIASAPSGAPALAAERNTTPGYESLGVIASLARPAPGGAAAGLVALLAEAAERPGPPLLLGQAALAAHLRDGAALAPQGVYIAAGTRSKGLLLEAHSPHVGRDWQLPLRSVSKLLVCVTVLALQDRGLLDIEQPLSAHLPEWAGDAERRRITLKHVMTHTAGLLDSMDHAAMRDHTISLAQASKLLAAMPLECAVGVFNYSNSAYQLLGAVAEAVTGQPWDQVFRELVGAPLGLQHTRWVNVFGGEEGAPNPCLANGCITTPADMQRIMALLLHRGAVPPPPGGGGGAPCGGRVLSDAAFALLVSPHVRAPPDTTDHGWLTICFPPDGSVHPKVQALVDAGLVPASVGEFGGRLLQDTQYSLGAWVLRQRSTGRRQLAAFGSGGSHACIHDADGGAPRRRRRAATAARRAREADPLWFLFLTNSSLCGSVAPGALMLLDSLEHALGWPREPADAYLPLEGGLYQPLLPAPYDATAGRCLDRRANVSAAFRALPPASAAPTLRARAAFRAAPAPRTAEAAATCAAAAAADAAALRRGAAGSGGGGAITGGAYLNASMFSLDGALRQAVTASGSVGTASTTMGAWTVIRDSAGRSSTGVVAINAVLLPETSKVLIWARVHMDGSRTYEPGVIAADGSPEVSAVYEQQPHARRPRARRRGDDYNGVPGYINGLRGLRLFEKQAAGGWNNGTWRNLAGTLREPRSTAPGITHLFTFNCDGGAVLRLSPSNVWEEYRTIPSSIWPTPYYCGSMSMAGTSTLLVLEPETGYVAEVLLVNGARSGLVSNLRGAARDAWLYDPKAAAGSRFRTLAASGVNRLYHSTALLLPDASVLVAGSEYGAPRAPRLAVLRRAPRAARAQRAARAAAGECTAACARPTPWQFQHTAERFLPPYFFMAGRPGIASELRYGGTVTLTYSGAVNGAVLMAPAAVTHQVNMGQRGVKLAVAANDAAARRITLRLPPNAYVMQPGWAMLFLLNGQLPCSKAAWVRLS